MARPAIGDRHILDRKIPSTRKYDGARATVDTGTNVLNTRPPPSGPKKPVDERFKRIRCNTLFRHLSASPDERELDIVLIDVREREEYEVSHIEGALHYPPTMLSHAVHPFLPEMFAAKNKEGRAIVAYDLDESVAPRVAGLIFEKGIDNIFLLTGGLQECVREHTRFVVGDAPPPSQEDRRPVRRTAGTPSSVGCGASDAISTMSRTGVSNVSSHKPRALSSSLARAASTPQGWR
eukprot:TRINITY_DN4824_c0_g3_i2.p1 TRINITY_DN4824_c0_g3~~TRINITY_DN4824_c0_g3_i2.p1  ORF type:complete len:260 (+),score=50.92 TRINITY_DN4824_c0_g3_i2:75-782(+)